MIRDPERLSVFEDAWSRVEKADVRQRLRVIEAMLQEARALNVWPPADALEGLDVDRSPADVLRADRPA
jgi:hypothetical protein